MHLVLVSSSVTYILHQGKGLALIFFTYKIKTITPFRVTVKTDETPGIHLQRRRSDEQRSQDHDGETHRIN